MRARTSLLLCLLMAIPATAGPAADNRWLGTWKLDAARSHQTGDTFSYSEAAGGLLHYADGSTESYDFGLDGKEYKSWGNRTVSWTATDKDAWDTVTRAGGKLLSKSHRALSGDGKTLTVSVSGTWPDGSARHQETVYTRVSGTDGLLGTWRSVKASPSGPPTFVISSPAPGVLRYEIPEWKASAEGRPDGSEHPYTGPHLPPGMTNAFELVAPDKMTYTLKLDGKPDSYGVQTLAPDGRSFTDLSWNAGKENEKLTSVYVKQ